MGFSKLMQVISGLLVSAAITCNALSDDLYDQVISSYQGLCSYKDEGVVSQYRMRDSKLIRIATENFRTHFVKGKCFSLMWGTEGIEVVGSKVNLLDNQGATSVASLRDALIMTTGTSYGLSVIVPNFLLLADRSFPHKVDHIVGNSFEDTPGKGRIVEIKTGTGSISYALDDDSLITKIEHKYQGEFVIRAEFLKREFKLCGE